MAGRPAKIIIAVLLVAIGVLVWQSLTPPPTDEERLLDLAEDAMEALLDGDYEEIWDLIGEEAREQCAEALAYHRNLDPSRPEDADRLASMKKHVGLTPADLEGMDPEKWYVAVNEGELLNWQPQEMLRVLWSDLEIGEVTILETGETARVDLGAKDYDGREFVRCLFFRKIDDDWCYRDISFCHMKFRTLDWKLAAYLPREKVEPTDIDLVIELGPEAVYPEEQNLLGKWLVEKSAERDGKMTVLIDAAPLAGVQRVIGAVDAARTSRNITILFTRPTEGADGPPPGIRVNGVPITKATEAARYTEPADHPAVRRILTLTK